MLLNTGFEHKENKLSIVKKKFKLNLCHPFLRNKMLMHKNK